MQGIKERSRSNDTRHHLRDANGNVDRAPANTVSKFETDRRGLRSNILLPALHGRNNRTNDSYRDKE